MTPKSQRTQKPRADAKEAPGAIDPDSLENLSRDELIAVAKGLLKRRKTRDAEPPVDPDDVAAAVENALDYEWERPQRLISRDVYRHVEAGQRHLNEERWDDALRGAVGIIRGFAEGYDPSFDHDGEVAMDLQAGIEVAAAALKQVATKNLRNEVFDALLELWTADVGHGGIGLADEVPGILKTHASKAQKERMATRVKDMIAKTGDGWRREATAHLYLGLVGGQMDDEAYLDFCRKSGLHMERVVRFMARRQPEEAARAASDVAHHELTDAADLLVKAGHAQMAVELVRTRLVNPDAKNFTDRFKAWLQKRAESTNDLPQARKLAWERFRDRRTMETYSSLRKVAKSNRMWPADEKEILALLDRPEDGALLTEIHLAERRVGPALESLKTLTDRFRGGWGHDQLKHRVAKAAEKEFPEEARDLYLELADGLIGRKTRTYYAQAAPFVGRASELDRRVNPDDPRHRVIEDLSRRYGGYPALWDELRKVGLRGLP